MTPEYSEAALRLLAAVFVGAALGLTRDVRDKPAGLRTMALVALGSAIVAMTGQALFADQTDAQSRALQGVIQGVMTGVGFIGAGAVLHGRNRVKGLTSAAIVWVAAALGVACGLGYWPPVIVGGGAALFLIVVIHPIETWIERAARKRKQSTKPPTEAP